MAADTVRHPLFSRLYARVSAHAEERGQAEHRRELLAGLSGRVIEVGAGHGVNFSHYPAAVAFRPGLAEYLATPKILGVARKPGVPAPAEASTAPKT